MRLTPPFFASRHLVFRSDSWWCLSTASTAARFLCFYIFRTDGYVGGGQHIFRPDSTTLTKKRVFGGGPKYIKAGKRVVYYCGDLDTWMASLKRSNTSEYSDV